MPAPKHTTNNGHNLVPTFGADVVSIIEKKRMGAEQKITADQYAEVLLRIEDGEYVEHACKQVGISKASFYRLKEAFTSLQDVAHHAQRVGEHALLDKALNNVVSYDPASEADTKLAQVKVTQQRSAFQATVEYLKRKNPAQWGDKVQNLNVNANVDISPVDFSKYVNKM